MLYKTQIAGVVYNFKALKELLAKASPARSGDYLAGVVAETNLQRVATQWVLADLPENKKSRSNFLLE